MKKYFIFISLIFLNSYILNLKSAQAAIRYPVRELDNCRNQNECRLYCEIPKNTPSCWAFAKYGPPSLVLGETTVTDEEVARQKGITFPLSELGNCAGIAECRDFCRLEANKSACTDFALKKNLQQSRVKSIAADIMQKARTELSCDSKTSCHNFCRKPENLEICRSFGEKYELTKKSATPSALLNPALWQKSADELGCSNQSSCKNLCTGPENKRRCSAFAAKYALGTFSGSQKSAIAKELIGSSLCKNEVECAAYCQKNPEECKGYMPDTASSSAQKDSYLGPGGCRTDNECREYCIAHPDECPNFPKKISTFGELPKVTPVE